MVNYPVTLCFARTPVLMGHSRSTRQQSAAVTSGHEWDTDQQVNGQIALS
jgi:hypothetical protein